MAAPTITSAIAKLAKYEAVAIDWPRYPDGRCIRCGKCDQSMFMSHDMYGVAHIYTDDERQALIVAHIRQVHAEIIDATD